MPGRASMRRGAKEFFAHPARPDAQPHSGSDGVRSVFMQSQRACWSMRNSYRHFGETFDFDRYPCDTGRSGALDRRPAGGGSGGATDDSSNPRGLASLVAMLQSQRGLDASAAAAALNGRSRLSQQRQGFAGIGLAAAAAGDPGKGGGVHSHAISPSPTSYQPASPQM